MTTTQTPVPSAQLAATVRQTSPCTPRSYFTTLGDMIIRRLCFKHLSRQSGNVFKFRGEFYLL